MTIESLEQMQLGARDGYVACALWSCTDDAGESFDYLNYSADDVDVATLAAMHDECDQFVAAYLALIVESGMTPEQCGHDLWLTRNRHGAGFWDRGYPKAVSDALTEAAHLEGSRDLYIGDDGRIYQS